MKSTAVMILVSLFAISSAFAQEIKQQDTAPQEKLEGKWAVSEIMTAGKKQTEKAQLTFEGKSLIVKFGDLAPQKCTFKIDASKSPSHLDIAMVLKETK